MSRMDLRSGRERAPGKIWRCRRLVLVAVLLAPLAACTRGDVLLDRPGAGYVQAAAAAAPVDWSKAKTVAVMLSNFQFSPATLVFRENVPYKLLLRNTGAREHTFVSLGFFKAIAAEKLISSDGAVAKPYVASIAVPAGAEKELHFVPVRKGTYGLECTVFLHQAFGMEGSITIR